MYRTFFIILYSPLGYCWHPLYLVFILFKQMHLGKTSTIFKQHSNRLQTNDYVLQQFRQETNIANILFVNGNLSRKLSPGPQSFHLVSCHFTHITVENVVFPPIWVVVKKIDTLNLLFLDSRTVIQNLKKRHSVSFNFFYISEYFMKVIFKVLTSIFSIFAVILYHHDAQPSRGKWMWSFECCQIATQWHHSNKNDSNLQLVFKR